MNEKKSNITIYNQRLAGYLMLNGFPLLGMEHNKFDTSQERKKNVFFFPNSDDLQVKMKEWKKIDGIKVHLFDGTDIIY